MRWILIKMIYASNIFSFTHIFMYIYVYPLLSMYLCTQTAGSRATAYDLRAHNCDSFTHLNQIRHNGVVSPSLNIILYVAYLLAILCTCVYVFSFFLNYFFFLSLIFFFLFCIRNSFAFCC